MKWKHKPPYGTKRIIKKFAFFPIYCSNGDAAWLETVYIRQIFSNIYDNWINMEFCTSLEKDQ